MDKKMDRRAEHLADHAKKMEKIRTKAMKQIKEMPGDSFELHQKQKEEESKQAEIRKAQLDELEKKVNFTELTPRVRSAYKKLSSGMKIQFLPWLILKLESDVARDMVGQKNYQGAMDKLDGVMKWPKFSEDQPALVSDLFWNNINLVSEAGQVWREAKEGRLAEYRAQGKKTDVKELESMLVPTPPASWQRGGKRRRRSKKRKSKKRTTKRRKSKKRKIIKKLHKTKEKRRKQYKKSKSKSKSKKWRAGANIYPEK